MNTTREKGNPIADLARVMKETGYNKDVILSRATVIDEAPLTVRLEGNNLETSNLQPMAHLMPQYHRFDMIFDGDLGRQAGTIMIDNGLEMGDLVYVIYDMEKNSLKGFIIGKEE
ncbi:DUF2577 family protein [Planococcus faecalis]|uniref:DUF2577 domain-containing protein n=1 Tax=Planococcus faecalis TaxID=1598147 RepID=A0ABN4XP12_9BACL|nr:DUF2577 family protein [Planococcus faecalis]AQU79712.1 hypothetical protein AJGP001_10750 [Planococcus faecalis]OHX55290.1 hypothetical protein BB777_04420 [Planococcus faecalis]